MIARAGAFAALPSVHRDAQGYLCLVLPFLTTTVGGTPSEVFTFFHSQLLGTCNRKLRCLLLSQPGSHSHTPLPAVPVSLHASLLVLPVTASPSAAEALRASAVLVTLPSSFGLSVGTFFLYFFGV